MDPFALKEEASNRDDLVSLVKLASKIYYNGEQSVSKRLLESLVTPRDRILLKLGFGKRKSLYPFMTDVEFDAVQDELRRIDPKNPELKAIGAPVARKVKVRLPIPMPSLDKIKPHSGAVPQWLRTHTGPYLVSDKLDGVSILIRNSTGKIEAYTRGDGIQGGDISFMVPHFKLPTIPKGYALRVEALIPPSVFEQKWASEFVNPRNMAAGLTNRNDVHTAVKDISMVVFEVLQPRGIPSKQLSDLKAKGFTTVPFKVYNDLTELDLVEILQSRRQKSKYEIDGLVITQNKKNPLPVSGNPDWTIAFKSEATNEKAQATIVNIDWQVSRTGFIIPVLEIEPVRLRGVTIRRVTAHNAKFVFDNKLGPGAKVEIIRSGEVIPKVVGVVVKTKAQMPPASIGDWEWDGVHIKLKGESSSRATAQLKSIEFFFATMGVERFKSATIQKFIDKGIDTVPKILKLPRTQFINMEGGSKVLQAVYDQIQEKISNLPLPTLMAASQVFGRSFGNRRASAIVKAYPNIMEFALLPKQKIIGLVSGIPGFDTLTATKFAEGLPVFHRWLSQVPINPVVPRRVKTVSNKLQGQLVLMTGFRDSDLTSVIKQNGGDEASSAKTATILLAKDPNGSSSKLNTARERGIPIMTIEQFKRKFQL